MKIGLPMLLTLIFLILKLCDKIAWSWWWVFSPLWIGVALLCFLLMILGLIEVLQSKQR